MTEQAQKPERKIVQICANQATKRNDERLFALCNDGTLWEKKYDSTDDAWYLMQPIPQEDVQ